MGNLIDGKMIVSVAIGVALSSYVAKFLGSVTN